MFNKYLPKIFLFLGIFLIFNSCNRDEKKETERMIEIEKGREAALSHFTAAQKLMAEKAIKFPNENNPAVLHKFNADPAVLVYNDTVYVYCTNDSQQVDFTLGKTDNGYDKINTLNVFSTKDLVNWTDCGIIKVAGVSGAAKWARNSWAPAICTKKIDGKDKFFLYFADSANGIGVLSADSPTGPFIDPRGKALISRDMPNCQDVYWLFDPAVLVDDDGKGYIYFGGGHQADFIHPKSARCAALSDDMISLACDPIQIDPPFLFEDSGINKIGDTYYYSYCTNWTSRDGVDADPMLPIAVIAYMTSKNPLGPFEYQGYALENPGTYFGDWGNNHHWMFKFHDKYYMAYHGQIIEKTVGFEKGGYRHLLINEFKVNEDGSWPIQSMKKTGVEQVGTFNPYEKISAATLCSSRNMIVSSKQTLYPLKNGGYICIKGVNFSKGAAKIDLTLAEGHEGGTIKILLDNFSNGEMLGQVDVTSETSACTDLTFPEGNKVRDLYFVFEGDVELESWIIK